MLSNLTGDPKKLNDEASATRLAWILSSAALEAKGERAELAQTTRTVLETATATPELHQRLATSLRAVGRRDEVVSTLQAYAIDDKENVVACRGAGPRKWPATLICSLHRR